MECLHYKRIFLSLLLSLLFSHFCFAGLPIMVEGQLLPSLAPMLEKSMPAVVNISTSKKIQSQHNPLFRGVDPLNKPYSLGSGVIVNSQHGYILTSHHVIDKADKIMVILSDGRQFNAILLGSDSEADVAVLQIPANNLTALPIADSNQLRVGDFVVAIGNPFGLGQTVTSGIISALGRTGLGIEGYEDFIQTDASINPGNSGGALVNLRGEFIGMNTAILAPNGSNVGIGFAIPSNMAMTLKETLVKYGKVSRGLLGISTQNLTKDLIKAFELNSQYGALVNQVEAHSAANRAGLEAGDIIIALNGEKVRGGDQIRNMIGLLQIGDKIQIDFMRENNKQTTHAILGQPQQRQLLGKLLHHALKNTHLTSTVKGQVTGVIFTKIQQNSYAWRAGLRVGDIIVSANRYRIHNLDEFKQVINPNRVLLINIQRGKHAFFLILK